MRHSDIAFNKMYDLLGEAKLKIHRAYVGNYFTALEMIGITFTVMKLIGTTTAPESQPGWL
jgi:dihydroxyacetone kinase-like protein